MDMFKILTKFSEIDSKAPTTLNEASEKKGVTVHKGKYGTSHKAGDESHKGEDGEKKSSDTSHLQSFLGKKPEGHDSDDKKGRVHTLSNKPPKDSEDSEYGDEDEAPKKRGRPKKNLKDWIEALDEMIAEAATAQPMGATAGGAGTASGAKFKVQNNPDGSREVVDTTTGLSREYPQNVANQASTDANKLNVQAQQQAQQQQSQQQGQQTVKEEEIEEKWDKETKVAPSERGKYAGKSKAELLKMYNALKKSGPHKKGSPEFGKMRELQFAIRAKKEKDSWGKVSEGDYAFGAQPSPLSMANQKPVAEGTKMSKKKIKEGTDPHEAARSEGRSHAMAGHPYSCRHNKGTMEAQCYHEGYVHALEECYGQQNEGAMEEDQLLPPQRNIFRGKPDVSTVEPFKRPAPGTSKELGRQMPGAGLSIHGDQFDDGPIVGAVRSGMNKLRGMFKEDDLEESPFSWAAKNTPTGEKFTVGGKTFTKKADEGMYEEGWNEGADLDAIASDPMLESWDKQLNQLLSEDAIKEGLTVSTSTGQQGMPDSVSISASDEDAQKLMDLLKMSGLSGGQQSQSQPAQAAAEIARPGEALEVVAVDVDYEEEEPEEHGEVSGDPHSDVANGHKKTGIMDMPLGKHFSHNVEPEEIEVIEPYDHDEVIDALDCGDEMNRIKNKLMALESTQPDMAMPKGKGFSKNVEETDSDPSDAEKALESEEVISKLGKVGIAASKAQKSPFKVSESDAMLSLSKRLIALEGEEGSLPKKKTVKSPAMSMPDGKGFSIPDTEEEGSEAPEAYEQEEIINALQKGSKKTVKEEHAALAMPIGKGVSTEPTEKPTDIEEPKDADSVMNGLEKGGSDDSDRAFSELKRMIQKQLGTHSSKPTKSTSPSHDTQNHSDDDSSDESDEEDNTDDEKKSKVEEGKQTCHECGGMYEGEYSDHECDSSEKKLDEWANSLRDKKSKLKDEQFQTDESFMTDTLSGGANGPKGMHKHGYHQGDNPLTMEKGEKEPVSESREALLSDWLKLSGIK